VRKGARDDAFLVSFCFASLHGVGLAGSCLPIGEDGAIVSREDGLDDGEGRLLEDVFLKAAGLEGHIEAEGSLLLSLILLVVDYDLSSFGDDVDDFPEALLFFFVGHGPASDSHLDAFFLCHA